MATPTYDLIQTTTLTNPANSILFSSLPFSSVFKDIVFVANFQMGATNSNVLIKINNSTSFNYNRIGMTGDGSNASGFNNNSISSFNFDPTSSGPINLVADFVDYSASNKHVTMAARWNDPGKLVGFYSLRFASTGRMSSFEIYSNNQNFVSGSTFSIYGIAG